MPRIVFQNSAGEQHAIDVPVGMSLMRAATSHGIDGIVGDCGGGLACGTCHVFVQEQFLDLMPTVSSNEDQMLDMTMAPRQANSRLSCQIVVTEAMDGMVVIMADPQI